MTTEYIVEAEHRGGLHFAGSVEGFAFEMDYPVRPDEQPAGPKPMAMLLASLASCAGGAVAALMRRTRLPFDRLTVVVRGQRRSEHPTVFTEIAIEFVFDGDVDQAAAEGVVAQAESTVCPIWAMLKPSTPITSSVRVRPASAPAA